MRTIKWIRRWILKILAVPALLAAGGLSMMLKAVTVLYRVFHSFLWLLLTILIFTALVYQLWWQAALLVMLGVCSGIILNVTVGVAVILDAVVRRLCSYIMGASFS